MLESLKTNRPLKVLWYKFLQLVLQVVCSLFFSIRVYGKENIPIDGPVLIVSNHQSFLDPVLIGVGIPRQVNYLARDTLFRHKIFRWLIESLNAIPIRREENDLSAMRKCIDLLEDKKVLLIFPEGTRTLDGSVRAMRPGFGLIANKPDAYVVPACIEGAYKSWPRSKKLPRLFSPIKVMFGKPFKVENISKKIHATLSQSLREKIVALQNKLQTIGKV